MDILLEGLKHYAVYIGTVLVLALLAIFWTTVSTLMTWCFSKITLYGDWETNLDRGSGSVAHEDVKLRQFIHRIWGVTKTKDGKGTTYRFQGRISGERLSLIYRQTNSTGFEVGAILLSISVGGKKMEGYEIGVDPQTNRIYSYAYNWTKRT